MLPSVNTLPGVSLKESSMSSGSEPRTRLELQMLLLESTLRQSHPSILRVLLALPMLIPSLHPAPQSAGLHPQRLVDVRSLATSLRRGSLAQNGLASTTIPFLTSTTTSLACEREQGTSSGCWPATRLVLANHPGLPSRSLPALRSSHRALQRESTWTGSPGTL